LKEKVDAIVVTHDALFTFNGGLAKAVSQVAPELKEKVEAKKKAIGNVPMALPIYTKVGREDRKKLECKAVMHVSAPAVTTKDYYKWLTRTFEACLKEAVKRRLSSISFSAIGTGGGGIPPQECARAFFEVAMNLTEGAKELEHVRLICVDVATLKAFSDWYSEKVLKKNEE